MLRGGRPISSAQDDSKLQKQKKRLSFKDPEVEGPLKHNFLNHNNTGCRSKTLVKPKRATPTSELRRVSTSLEDLTLEDQALLIAQSVGSAFSHHTSSTDKKKWSELTGFDSLDSVQTDIQSQRETEIQDSSPSEGASYQRSCQLKSFRIPTADQEFLDTLVPPLQDETMRAPSTEGCEADSSYSNSFFPEESSSFVDEQEHTRPTMSSTSQHQIQLLKYQLDQQNQQTQMALHQVQLLQDQLEAESSARRKAQEQNNQLMQQNKELLNHMEKLFQQIEELERQILTLEQERRGNRRISSNSDIREASLKQPSSYVISRRPSNELVNSEKTTPQIRPTPTPTPRKTSVTPAKPLATSTSKTSIQNSPSISTARKTPSIPTRQLNVQTKTPVTREKDSLKIEDTSPPVQSGTVNPFSSAWKAKTSDADTNAQSIADKTAVRGRAGSFSSFIKKPQESVGGTKSSLFGGSSSSLLSTSITGKKHSSSTSDLYTTPNTFQGKSSLMIEESSSSVKTATSNLSLSSVSKLPRYQPTGWQRRTSLTSDGEQVSGISKDPYKSTTKSSLFNR